VYVIAEGIYDAAAFAGEKAKLPHALLLLSPDHTVAGHVPVKERATDNAATTCLAHANE
jgi:hypothetical protein